MKLDVDTLPTVPDAPPAAGPDRALACPPLGELEGKLPAVPLPALLQAASIAVARSKTKVMDPVRRLLDAVMELIIGR